MQVIQTSYKGYNFRSRLEARWAVFFDALGLDWEYEAEGFQLDNGMMYLPDFKVTFHIDIIYRDLDPEVRKGFCDFCYYIEVKPRCTTSDEKFECFKAEGDGKYYAALVSGDPMDNASSYLDVISPMCPNGNLSHFLMYAAASHRDGMKQWTIKDAAARARSARFEHGESGGTTKFDRTVAMIESWKAKWKEEVK